MVRLSRRLTTLNQEQIAYINGCQTLQRAVWRICHEDPLFAIRNQIKRYTLREAVLVLISLRERNYRAILKLTLHKWLKNVQRLNQNKERIRALLKIIFLNYEAKTKNNLSRHLLRWKANASISEQDILKKYGYLFEFLDMLKFYSLLPAKRQFLSNLRKTINPEKFLKPLKNCFKHYDRSLLNKIRKTLYKWKYNARNGALDELKRKILRNAVLSTIRSREKQLLLKAFRKWYSNVQAEKLLEEFGDADFLNRVRSLVIIYGKWNRVNRLNQLARAFAKWRLNTTERGEPLSSRILRAKQHMLKHNINKNAEDLLNALRNIAQAKRLEDLLRKIIRRAPKYNIPLLRKMFKKWYDNTKDLRNKEIIKKLKLKYITDITDRVRREHLKKIMRKTVHTWRRNTSGPKTTLPDTEKAINLLRKATVQPFFTKMRENMLKDMNKERFRALIACYFRKNDNDLLHWWFGEWRKKAFLLKIYELKALLIKHIADTKVRNEKLKVIRELKDRLNNYRLREVIIKTILRSLINRIDRLMEEICKAKLERALYVWRSKIDNRKDKERLDNFDKGTKILRRYCWRVTHEDVVNAFDYKITVPYLEKVLKRIIISTDKNNNRDVLLKALYRWRMNCAKPQEDKVKKLRKLFKRYLVHEPIRKRRFSLYKDIIKTLKKCHDDKEEAARKIADYLRGIKEIPDQLRNLKISKYLIKIIHIYGKSDLFRLKYALKEWSRRARNVKADEDARIIQKFVRDKLNRRLRKRVRFEEGVEHTTKYVLKKIFEKIVERANKNRIPDILLKYYLRRNAEDMKNLRDKFNHWRNLLPYMRLEDASSKIQANLRGYFLRKDFRRFNRITELLYKIIGRIIEKDYVEPAFQKWRKNARKIKCHEDARIIQEFCRRNLYKRLRGHAMQDLQYLFKDYVFKLIADMLKTKTVNPDDIEILHKTIKRVIIQEPFEKLIKKVRWRIIIKALENIPSIYERSRKDILRKYLEIWYTNAIIIPDEMANKIQNAWRSYLARNKFNKLQKLQYILEQLVIKAINTDEDKKLATLMKWNKNARLIKCDEDARIIQNFCRKIHRKTVTKVGLKWKNLAKRIKPHIIYNVSKFIHMNNVLNKILKRRFFDNLIDRANKNYLKEILKYLIIKQDTEYNNNLLRRYLREWLDRARQLGDQDHYASTYIQSYYRGYLTRKHLHNDRKLQDILSKIILRLIYNSDSTLPAAFQKWRKNARLVKCDEDARIIQDFCRTALDKIKKIKDKEYLDKIYEGLDRLSYLRLNIRYAWDKIRDYNKKNALVDLVGFLQDKINNVKREILEEIYQYGIDQVLRKLFPLREKYINNLLRKKLRQWRDKAKNLGRLRAAEMIQRNWFYYLIEKIKKRITILLRDIVIRKDESETERLRRVLLKWRDNARKLGRDAAEKRITKFLVDRYLISKARNNWKDLTDKLKRKIYRDSTWEVLKKIKVYITLKDLMNDLNDKIKKDGLNQLKEGGFWKRTKETLRIIIEEQNYRSKDIIKRIYLNRWMDKVIKLRERDNKLIDAMNEIEKRQLIQDVDTVANVETTKKFTDSIPVARAVDFFDRLRNLDKYRRNLLELKNNLLNKLIRKRVKRIHNILRNKLQQWNEKAHKIREEAAKSRIAKWTEDRYRISNARKNWKKLCDLYDLYLQKRPLYEIRKRLIKFMTLNDLADKLRNRFTKTGKDQFKEGVKHIIILKYLKKLFEDIDDVNRYILLKYYLNKWNDKTKKLKQREDALNDALDTLTLKNLIDSTNTIKNASIAKKVDSAVPVARAFNFFDKVRKISEYITKYTKLGDDLVKSKDDLDTFNKYTLLNKVYKIYYYKVLDNMFNIFDNLKDRYKNHFGDYFLKLLQYILLSKRTDQYKRIGEGDKEPTIKTLLFRGKTNKKIKAPQDRNALAILLPSLAKFLNDKFLNQKKWAWDILVDNDRALKFCKLYKIFSDKTTQPPKRDLVDLLKAEHAYMNGLGAANCDLFKLLRRYWIKLVCDSMLAPSRIYKLLYLIKMVMMHKTIAYQRFIRELVRKWRFSAFVQNISRRKLEHMYKNLHVSYLQMANELFGEKGTKNASVIKEFERIVTKMGVFTNEDYNTVNEENFCEKITKRYVFQPMPLLLEKEGPTQFFASGIEIEDSGENNEDYYVDQELGGETIGKYKQETNKSSSKQDKNSSRLSKY